MNQNQALMILVLALGTASCAVDEAVKFRHIPPGYSGTFETWWNDVQVRERGDYRDGVRHGQITVYHPDGTVESSGTYESGVPIGEMRYFAPGGGLRLVEIVHHGVLDGPREEYDVNGNLRVLVPYINGRRQGLERRWHGNGEVSTEGYWAADLPSSQWRHWDPAGRLLSVESFWIAEGEAVGYFESTIDPTTGGTTAQSMKRLQGTQWVGWRTFWHDNGVQSGLTEYVDGLREGRDVSWDRGGRKSVEGTRVADLRSGTWRFWDEAGQLLDERVYLGGELLAESLEGAFGG